MAIHESLSSCTCLYLFCFFFNLGWGLLRSFSFWQLCPLVRRVLIILLQFCVFLPVDISKFVPISDPFTIWILQNSPFRTCNKEMRMLVTKQKIEYPYWFLVCSVFSETHPENFTFSMISKFVNHTNENRAPYTLN